MIITQEEFERLASDLALKVIHVGTDEINFKILEMLPTDVKTLIQKLNLTKAPINNHLNELEILNLLQRERGTGKVMPTENTKFLLEMKCYIQDRVKINLLWRLREMIR